MKSILALAGALALAVAAWPAPVRAVTLEYPPYEFSEGGEARGIAVDIIREAFRRAGRELLIDVLPFPRALDDIRTGAADVIFTYYEVPGREAFSDYSREPLVEQSMCLFTRKDSPLAFDGDLGKLAGRSFGLVNFSYGPVLDAFIAQGKIRRADPATSALMNLEKLLAGRFEVMPSDRWVAYYNYDQISRSGRGPLPAIRELRPEVETFHARIGYTKARDLSALRDAVDRALRSMRADGSYSAILARWTKALVR